MDDPISHCLAGNSLLLTGLPGTGKTHLARTIVARLREQGEAAHLVSKTHCSEWLSSRAKIWGCLDEVVLGSRSVV